MRERSRQDYERHVAERAGASRSNSGGRAAGISPVRKSLEEPAGKIKRESVTFRLPSWLLARVRAESDNTDVAVTRVVENALREYLAERCDKCGQAIPQGDE